MGLIMRFAIFDLFQTKSKRIGREPERTCQRQMPQLGERGSAFNDPYASITNMEEMADTLEDLHISSLDSDGTSYCSAFDSVIKEIDRLALFAHREDLPDIRKRNF